MPKIVAIINPISGPKRRGGAADRVAVATRTFQRLGMPGEVRVTERGGHAHELSGEAADAGADLIIGWGGDGTINEVARAIVQRSDAGMPSPALGIVPGGSGNGLARELGIPFDPAQAIEHALRATGRFIDAGELGGHLFFNVAGIGLDAHVAALVTTRVHHRGLLPYLKASAGDLIRYHAIDYSVTAEGVTREIAALVLAFANSKQWGFGAQIAPGADLQDGLLDFVAVRDRGLLGNIVRVPSMFLGRIHRSPGIDTQRIREMTIRSRHPMLFHVDGEAMQGGDTLVARARPRALELRA